MMNSERPRFPFAVSGSVRASSASTLARPEKVLHAFAPLMRQPRRPSCSAGVARVWSEATSEPMSGSVTAIATSTSPLAMRGSHSRRCSSVPPASSALERISGRVASEPAAASEAAESSSVITIIERSPMPVPPYSRGIEEPKKPCAENCAISSSGTSRSWRWISWARGATSLRAKARAVSRVSVATSSSSSMLFAPSAPSCVRPISRMRRWSSPARTAARASGVCSASAASAMAKSSHAASMLERSACAASAA